MVTAATGPLSSSPATVAAGGPDVDNEGRGAHGALRHPGRASVRAAHSYLLRQESKIDIKVMKILHVLLLIVVSVLQEISVQCIQRGPRCSVCP